MSDPKTFSDEALTAYLDGEADAVTAADITTTLAADVALANRLAELELSKAAITKSMDSLLAAAPAYTPPAANSNIPPLLPWAGGLVAGLALGAAMMFGLTRPASDADWMQAVASYQALYVTKTLSQSDATAPDAQLVALGAEIARDLTGAADLAPLEYRRAQLLGFEGRPLVQIAYLTEDGAPVALCVLQLDGRADLPPQSRPMMGMAAAAWQTDGYGFLLIGGDDQDLIDQLARQVAPII